MPFVKQACWGRIGVPAHAGGSSTKPRTPAAYSETPLSKQKRSGVVRTQGVNRISGIGLILLSLTALFVVLWGYTQPPLPDEGIGAHIFQLSIVALVPVTLVFLATADWSRPSRSARPLAIAVAATVLAFAALYFLEHVYYPGQL